MENRIGKRERTATGLTFTWYVRDAQARQCLDLLFQQDLAIPVPIFYIGSYVTTTNNDFRGTNFTALIRLFEHPIYGSSRLGSYQSGRIVYPRTENQGPYIYQPGLKQYELSNHLGNVLATVSHIKQGVDSDVVPDGSIDFERAVVKTQQSYYPFGMLQPEMSYTLGGSKYRFGFNGKENDDEVKGEGNSLDFGARIYDPRLGRFLSLDPCARKFPGESNYIFAGNSPIVFIDVDGKFKFSESTLALLKEKYPTTYKYLYENAKSGASGNILEIANSRRVVEAMIINMPNGNPNRDKMNEQVDYSIDIFLLTAQVIKDAYTPGGGQEILVKSNPGGVSNPLNTFGYNWAEDGTTYSSPIELNETILQAIEDAETPEAKQEALLNMVSVLTNEYLEDFGNDNHYILNKNGETTSTVGAKQAAKDIWGCFYIPQPDNDCAKKSIETRSSGGSAPDPSVIPVVPQ